MISVRLSEEEYFALWQLCSSTGARSVSDLTREAVRALLNGPNREELLGRYIDEFRAQMNKLDRKIEELSERVASSKQEMES
jgi:Arc/MetJ-type ribon-helix-helix transcriptional regulator